MRCLVLADTHIAPGSSRKLPDTACTWLTSVDAVLHAGDVVHPDLLDELSSFAPTYAVRGNNDGALGQLPERLPVDFEGLRVAMVHDAGPKKGRPARLHRWFPDADVVVYGHSHEAFDGPGAGQQWLFNPGSPTVRKRAPRRTFGILEIASSRLVHHEIIAA
jgi:putative phosphoesterase